MKVRYGLAAMFVGVVAMLIAIRSEGYLGGRTDGGPLRIGIAGALSGPVKAGERKRFGLMPALEGGPVEIQAVRPDFTSPGLRVRTPRSQGASAIGTRYDGDGDISLGLRAKRPGAYYALNLITDYKKGIRRFRRYSEQSLCVAVGEDARCGDARLVDEPLAEIGGPSDYGVPVREERTEVGVAGLEARIDLARPRTITVPLVNLTDRTIEVEDISLGEYEGPLQVQVTSEPATFSLRARAGRPVRLELEAEQCVEDPSPFGFEQLRARVDGDMVDVPLTVELSFSAPCPDGR